MQSGTVSTKISLVVFSVTASLVLLSLIPAVFPAFLLVTSGGLENFTGINPFESGELALPMFVADGITFVALFLYIKNRIPSKITGAIRFIFHFEVSREVAFLVIAVLLGLYIISTVHEILEKDPWEDYQGVISLIKSPIASQLSSPSAILSLQYLLLSASYHVFGSDRAVSLISSLALLVLTYFITTKIAKKRFAGLVAMAILLQSNDFMTYGTVSSYPSFWITLYLLSLYTIYIRWPVSPVSYVLSSITKTITAVFFPMTLFFIYRADIPRKKKIQIAISYGVALLAMITGFFYLGGADNIFGGLRQFSLHDFVAGFSAMAIGLRFDELVILFLFPLVVGLYLVSRRGNFVAESIMILLAGMLLLSPLLIAFTYLTNQPYRLLPIVLFFAIGVGVLLKNSSQVAPLQSKEH